MIKPKDIINKFTVEELCQTAEDYFKFLPDPTHQMAKPFSSLIEAPEILQNMGLLLSGLRLSKTMTILEFASGTCWFSRYLHQAQCITISIDTSKSALEIGKRLFKEFPIIGNPISEPQFLHFNGHKIDLPDESVDRIICNDAFHHIPNQDEVISEFARVLKRGGIAGFSEPGKFHSQNAQSQYEMKNYNVLENDILVSEIFTIAEKYGFTDIKIKLLSDMDVSLDQHQFLTNKREDSEFVSSIVDNIGNVMTKKTIFFLHKGEMVHDSRNHIGLSHSIFIDKKILYTKAGEDLNITLRVSNTGAATWLNKNIHDIGVVKIGVHLYDALNNLLNLDYSIHEIACETEPGQTFEQTIKIRLCDIGKFKITIDLVSGGICWFENIGSKPQLLTVNVE